MDVEGLVDVGLGGLGGDGRRWEGAWSWGGAGWMWGCWVNVGEGLGEVGEGLEG